MIESITITNDLDESITLELANPGKSGLAIKSIDGLGPAKADVIFSEVVTSDVSLYNSARLNERTINLKLLYLTEPSVEENRLKTYKYFPIKRKITFSIKTDTRTVKTEGYIEQNNQSIFDKKSGTTIQIKCPDPYFYDDGEEVKTEKFLGTLPMFEFPFENPSTTEKLIEFSAIQHYPTEEIIYTGDLPVGVKINIHANGAIYNPVIYNVETGETMAINTDKLKELTGHPIISGDDIIINTNKGQKSVTLIRTGEKINIIACLRSYSMWFTLKTGPNKFTYDAEYGGDVIQINYEYARAYEGI